MASYMGACDQTIDNRTETTLLMGQKKKLTREEEEVPEYYRFKLTTVVIGVSDIQF